MVKHGNVRKLTVAAEMVGMGVGIDNHHWFVNYLFYDLTQISNSTTVSIKALLSRPHQINIVFS